MPKAAKTPKEVSWLQPSVVDWIRRSTDLMLIDYEVKLIGLKDPSKNRVSKPGIDILCLARNGDLVVFELKAGRADIAALRQAAAYAQCVCRWSEQHVVRQRARKQSFNLDVDEVRAKIAEYLGGVITLSGRAQLHIVAGSFDDDIVERARELNVPLVQVHLSSFQRSGDEAAFKVELKDETPSPMGCERGEIVGLLPNVQDAAPSLRHNETFKTWCRRLRNDRTGLADFFREHLRGGTENNSAKHGGQLYFHYKQRGDAWTWVYHVTFRTNGLANVGRRTGFDDVVKLDGGRPTRDGNWLKRTLGVEDLYRLFPPGQVKGNTATRWWPGPPAIGSRRNGS